MLGASVADRVALSEAALRDPLLARVVSAHELAHVLAESHGSELDQERGADALALRVLSGLRPGAPGLARASRGLRLRACRESQSPADRARRALDAFAAMSPAEQQAFVARHYTSGSYGGQIRTHLEALSPAERTGKYRDTIRRILQLVERQEVRASTGMNDAQMAIAQAAHMDAQARATAAAAAHGPAPTPAQIQQAHRQSVQAMNLPPRPVNRWAALLPAQQATYRAKAATAIANIVSRAAARAPELGITASHLHFAPNAIDGASDARFAEYDDRNHRLNFGMDFTDTALVNPDFVLGSVVHEVFGHAEHGGIGEDYALELYRSARPHSTAALSPADRAGPLSRAERFGFGYQGTEIYAELREAQYFVAAPAGFKQGDDPAVDVRERVGLIKEKWDPTVARGLIRGLYARFALDPRITPAALRLFVDAVNHHFPGENLLDPRAP